MRIILAFVGVLATAGVCSAQGPDGAAAAPQPVSPLAATFSTQEPDPFRMAGSSPRRLAVIGVAAQSDFSIGPAAPGFGPSWQYSARAVVSTRGGVELAAGLTGRRGHSLPLYMS